MSRYDDATYGEFVDSNFTQLIVEKIQSSYIDAGLGDFTLNSKDDDGVECHKCVLSTASEVFSEQFASNETQLVANFMCVPIPVQILKDLLEYIYSGVCTITLDNVETLLRTSINWKLSGLEKVCTSFMQSHISIKNCISYHELATELHRDLLIPHTFNFMQYNYVELLQLNLLSDLSYENFYALLKSTNNFASEDAKLDSVLRWIGRNPSCTTLTNIYPLVKYDNLSIECLKDAQKNELLQHPLTLRLISDAVMMKLQEANVQLSNSQQSTLPSEELVCLSESQQICKFKDHSKEWSDGFDIPEWEDRRTAWCAYKNYVILAGAEVVLKGRYMALLDVKTNEVKRLPEMLNTLQGPGVYGLEDWVLVIGGKKRTKGRRVLTNEVQTININCPNDWVSLPPMLTAVDWPMVASYQHKLYVIGGDDMNSKCTSHLQVYNQLSQQWSAGLDIPIACNGKTATCVQQDSLLTIFTGTESCSYDCNQDQWVERRAYRRICDRSIISFVYKGQIMVGGILHGVKKLWIYEPSHRRVFFPEKSIYLGVCDDAMRVFIVTS